MIARKLFNGLIILAMLLPVMSASSLTSKRAAEPPYVLNGADAADQGTHFSNLSTTSASVVQRALAMVYQTTDRADEDTQTSSLARDQMYLEGSEAIAAQSSGTWRSYTNGNYVKSLVVENEYVWAATEGGVVHWSRNDGSYVKYTTQNSGLADNCVWAVAIDGAGHKWFGTWGGGVSEFDGDTWTTYTIADGLTDNKVAAIAIDGAGHKGSVSQDVWSSPPQGRGTWPMPRKTERSFPITSCRPWTVG